VQQALLQKPLKRPSLQSPSRSSSVRKACAYSNSATSSPRGQGQASLFLTDRKNRLRRKKRRREEKKKISWKPAQRLSPRRCCKTRRRTSKCHGGGATGSKFLAALLVPTRRYRACQGRRPGNKVKSHEEWRAITGGKALIFESRGSSRFPFISRICNDQAVRALASSFPCLPTGSLTFS